MKKFIISILLGMLGLFACTDVQDDEQSLIYGMVVDQFNAWRHLGVHEYCLTYTLFDHTYSGTYSNWVNVIPRTSYNIELGDYVSTTCGGGIYSMDILYSVALSALRDKRHIKISFISGSSIIEYLAIELSHGGEKEWYIKDYSLEKCVQQLS